MSDFQVVGVNKICSKCGENKPRTEYNKEHGRERAYCKICHRAAVAKWQSDNREHQREYHAQWCKDNPDKVREYAKKNYHNRSEESKAKKAIYSRKRVLESRYGITQKDWDRMHDDQGGLCALCRIPGRTGKHGKFAVDHNHDTGQVRGLLCTTCNVAIGALGETRENLQRAVDYVTYGWRKKCESQ